MRSSSTRSSEVDEVWTDGRLALAEFARCLAGAVADDETVGVPVGVGFVAETLVMGVTTSILEGALWSAEGDVCKGGTFDLWIIRNPVGDTVWVRSSVKLQSCGIVAVEVFVFRSRPGGSRGKFRPVNFKAGLRLVAV